MILTERNTRIPSGCAVAGIFNQKGEVFSSNRIIQSISTMHERSNGLGGGFACYGLYAEHPSLTVFHVLFDDKGRKEEFEEILQRPFSVLEEEPVPTRASIIPSAPYFHRYFVRAREERDLEDQVVSFVMSINTNLNDVYIISSGKNLGVFKGVGYPEEIAEFFRLEEYKGYSWLAHGRFPTNTPGWWGGAHPFSLLQYSVIHNGEISSYGTNRRFLSMKGYPMTQMTDTEVITSALDFLLRKEELPLDLVSQVLAPPLWEKIQRFPPKKREFITVLRQMYGSLLLNGPFSIIVGLDGGILALNDRLKLRSLVSGTSGDFLYFASEEAAIRAVSPKLDTLSFPGGGILAKGAVESAKKGDVA